MNICLISDFSGNLDEGMKVVGESLAKELVKTHHVLRVDVHKAIGCDVWCKLIEFNPDVLHYTSGPSPLSFIILRTLALVYKTKSGRNVKTVMSATQPRLPFGCARLLENLKPDILLVQSRENEEYFGRIGFDVKYLPNGVDIKKFLPSNERRKKDLRVKYGLREDRFVVLHVGSIRANRGLDALKSVANMTDCLVLIVGATSTPAEPKVISDLIGSGCTVWRKYVQSINEIYQLADLYVFPVEEKLGCIEIPLSVLEAMSCNLPIISTRFRGLPGLFTEGDGLFFVDNRSEISNVVKNIKSGRNLVSVQTRAKVMPYSWNNVTNVLSQYYLQLI